MAKILDADRLQVAGTVEHVGNLATASQLAREGCELLAERMGCRAAADVLVGGLPVFSVVAGGAS